MDLDSLLKCSWCGQRCRDRADLKAHHDEHRRQEALEQAAEAQPQPEARHDVS